MTKPLSEYEKARRFAAKREANRINSKNMVGENERTEQGTPRTNRHSNMSARRAEMLRYRTYPPIV